MHRPSSILISVATSLFVAAASGQPAPASAPSTTSAASAVAKGAAIPYPTVAEALAALKARDGDSVTVMTADGWITVDEPAAAARWSFTPSGYYAYPALVKRVIKRNPAGAAEVETTSLCESDKASCDKLVAEFHVLDERIRQAVQARGRRTPPPPPPMPVPMPAPPAMPASAAAPS